MSEAQEPGNLPLPEQISESQIVPDTDSQNTELPESEENCCGTSKDCKNGENVNEEDDNASESDWKPEGSGAVRAVINMLERGADPYQIAAMIGLEVTSEESPMTVIRHLVACLSQSNKRERQQNLSLDDIVDLIKKSKNIMILTGAGISVSCGIPDFRSKNGLYAKLAVDFPELPDPPSMFCLKFFKGDQRPFFRFAKEIYPGSFKPSPSHRFIAELEQRGKLLRNFTQNIDGLEQEAGIQNVIQCHGHFHTATCLDPTCQEKYKSSDIKEDIFSQQIPRCKRIRTKKRLIPRKTTEIPTAPTADESFETYEAECQSVIKPDIVFFGENLPKHFHKAMVDEKDKADLLIVMGSSLKVGPVNEIPDALDKSVPAILINRESLRYASEFDGELLGNCDDIVAILAKKLGWSDFSSDGDVEEVTREDLEKTAEENKNESEKENGEEAPPEKKLKMEETSEETVNEEATPVLTRPIRRPKIEVPKGVFCKLESGYQTVFHGHELLPEGEDSSSSESEDEEDDDESENGYEDIPESERKPKENITEEPLQAACNPAEASGSILTLPEPKMCQNSDENSKPL